MYKLEGILLSNDDFGDESVVDYITNISNPFNEIVRLDIKEDIDLDIYNLNGVLIYRKPLKSGNKQIDLTGFSSGVYLLNIKNNNDVYSIIKVIKQ